MSDFDLTPPSLPSGKPKDGLFKRLFRKEDDAPIAEQPLPASPEPAPQVDLDEIKRKLGLDDEPEMPSLPVAAPEPAGPKTEIKIENWTDDAPVPTTTSNWDITADDVAAAKVDARPDEFASDQTTPLHHEAVEKHLAVLDETQAKIEETLQKATTERPELPEWKLQAKEVTPEQYFILRNGQPVRSLKELIEILEYIDDTTFDHHVNEYRNDFSNWIRDVIGDAELADDVEHAEDRPGMLRSLLTHERKAVRQIVKDQQKLQQVVQKRQQTVKKLLTVEEQIAQLQRQLEQKTKELTGERKRAAKLIKDKLDAEVTKRLNAQKKALVDAREDILKAKKEYVRHADEYRQLVNSLSEREKKIMLKEHKAAEAMNSVKEEREHFQQEKEEARELLHESAKLKKQFEDMKKLDMQTKHNLEMISKGEIEISRQEETLRQREKKMTADLTRISAEQTKLQQLREEHNHREQAAKKVEADARKAMLDAERRSKEALDIERSTKDRIKAETQKLENLRKQIDKVLAKALGQKKKITSAVALRKELEKSLSTLKQEVVQERQEMEKEGYESYMQEKIATTPAGQPSTTHNEEIYSVNKRQLPIYAKVDECRQALERNDLVAARRIYNELREEFTKIKADATEKSALYNTIRELYDDIHLALLS
jgi:hypothetical protein